MSAQCRSVALGTVAHITYLLVAGYCRRKVLNRFMIADFVVGGLVLA